MKILNKRDLEQTEFNFSSDIDFQDFIYLYNRCTAEPYSFLVPIDTTLASDKLFHVSEESFRTYIKTHHGN